MTASVILGAVRTPLGSVHGGLAGNHPADLLGAVLAELLNRTGVAPEDVAEVVAGCVEQVGGQGGDVARGGVFAARWPGSVGGTTVDRGPTSGLAALAFAQSLVATGVAPVAIAAAVDVQSLVPSGAAAMGRHPYGRPWGSHSERRPMVPPGVAAERLDVPRAVQDAWALESAARAVRAHHDGRFAAEVVAVGSFGADEVPASRALEADDLAARPPLFAPDGTITAGNSAPVADGAAALLVADPRWAAARSLAPVATLGRVHLASCEPDDSAGAALDAARCALDDGGGVADTAELPESTAALACSLRAALGLDAAVVNPQGGALALGEPVGASDLRAAVTLVHRLARGDARSGLVVAGGFGLGAAVMVARPQGVLG